ncbi:MAG TPA: hypothetical protein VLT87_04090 [Thermoanaerobaculia bacterium]|nr:hypothetical protein [Thermoanaerobaculia bacterium]
MSVTGQSLRFAELIEDCELHYRAYADYLRGDALPGGYEEYLSHRGAE